jgi:Ankyrin repeats (3 copies)
MKERFLNFTNTGNEDESSDDSVSQGSDEDSYSGSESDSNSCFSSSGDEDKIMAIITEGISHTEGTNAGLSEVSDCGMKRSSSLPSLKPGEMNITQIKVMFNQTKLSDAAKGATRRHSLTTTSKEVLHIQGSSMTLDEKNLIGEQSEDPTSLYYKLLEAGGFIPMTFEYDQVKGFFQGITANRLSSYSLDIIGAVKSGDLDFLRYSYFELKRNMNCCNRFGESILHTACRHSQVAVVRFLIQEAQVDLRVVDDFGRTPCHDAAWQSEPNMEIIEMIITRWPDLLLICDKRGFSPLQYVRKNHWEAWNHLLKSQGREVFPRQLLKSNHVSTIRNAKRYLYDTISFSPTQRNPISAWGLYATCDKISLLFKVTKSI